MPDEKTAQPHAEAVQEATHEAETVGNPEHANPQPMMANAPQHKAEHEMPPSDEHPADGVHSDEEPHQDSVAPEGEAKSQAADDKPDAGDDDHHHAKDDDDHQEQHDDGDAEAEEAPPPPAVPGTPGNTGTILHSPPVTPAKAPDPNTIMPSKTASSNPKEGVPILDSNHTLSHIPPRDTTV